MLAALNVGMCATILLFRWRLVQKILQWIKIYGLLKSAHIYPNLGGDLGFSPLGERGDPQDPPSYNHTYSPRGQELSAKVSGKPCGQFSLADSRAVS